MCGEMASDVKATPLLVGLGLDSLSVNPAHIPYIKKIIRNLEFSKAEQLANECLSCLTEKEIIDKIEKFFKENLLQISKQAL
jgi:phosphotransferase system enzyme I (PtsI)